MKSGIAYFLLLLLTFPVLSQVVCRENVMTTNRFCRSNFVHISGGFYFFATTDVGDRGLMSFTFSERLTSSRPDGLMVKLDDGVPFRIAASAHRSDVHCRRSVCRWSVGSNASFTPQELINISTATTMLVSYIVGAYVSDPIAVDPRKITSWFDEWTSIVNSPAR